MLSPHITSILDGVLPNQKSKSLFCSLEAQRLQPKYISITFPNKHAPTFPLECKI